MCKKKSKCQSSITWDLNLHVSLSTKDQQREGCPSHTSNTKQGQRVGSTHSVQDTVLVLATFCIRNRTYQLYYPHSQTLPPPLIKPRLTTLWSFPFSSFPSNKLPNPVNSTSKQSWSTYPVFPFPLLVQTAASMPFGPILMSPPPVL